MEAERDMAQAKPRTEDSSAAHAAELSRLAKVMGQLSGIERMILDDRYCPEIVQQIRAATSALRAIEVNIIKRHISTCVKKSAKSESPNALDKKLKELMELIRV